MKADITLKDLNDSIEALWLSLETMRKMRARHCCPSLPGTVLEVHKDGMLIAEDKRCCGTISPFVAKQVTPTILVDDIEPADEPPYYKLLVHEQEGDGWGPPRVMLEVDYALWEQG